MRVEKKVLGEGHSAEESGLGGSLFQKYVSGDSSGSMFLD